MSHSCHTPFLSNPRLSTSSTTRLTISSQIFALSIFLYPSSNRLSIFLTSIIPSSISMSFPTDTTDDTDDLVVTGEFTGLLDTGDSVRGMITRRVGGDGCPLFCPVVASSLFGPHVRARRCSCKSFFPTCEIPKIKLFNSKSLVIRRSGTDQRRAPRFAFGSSDGALRRRNEFVCLLAQTPADQRTTIAQ